jgi:hypothetical protein
MIADWQINLPFYHPNRSKQPGKTGAATRTVKKWGYAKMRVNVFGLFWKTAAAVNGSKSVNFEVDEPTSLST